MARRGLLARRARRGNQREAKLSAAGFGRLGASVHRNDKQDHVPAVLLWNWQ